MLLIKLISEIYPDKPFVIKPLDKGLQFTNNPANYVFSYNENKYILVKTRQKTLSGLCIVPNLEFLGKGTTHKEALDTIKEEIKRLFDLGFLMDTDLMPIIIPHKDLTFENIPFINKEGAKTILIVSTVFSWYFEKTR
jgi:hypothetical protein